MKKALEDLTVFGSAPLSQEPLHVGRPNIGNRERLQQRVDDIVDRRWLSNHGRYVQEFEENVARIAGVRHCVAMCNGTVALEIAIRALGLKGEVILPSFTFVATAHALQWQEITPVFCDVDPATHNIDPAKVESLVTPQTTGIIGVHVWGRACPVEALSEIANRRGLRLLFDSAHAFGCSHRGKMIGGFGDAEVFSFHATKFINALEGGAVVTNDDELARKIRLMKNFGFTDYDKVDYIGTNGKMNEMSAAMGLTNLESMHEFIGVNRCNYDCYRDALRGIPGVTLVAYDAIEKHNYQYCVLEIDEEGAGISRDMVVRILHAENVLARRYFYPGCHRMEPYRTLYPRASLMLLETERLADRVLCLPTGTAVSDGDIRAMCGLLRFVIDNGSEIRRRIDARESGGDGGSSS